MNKTNFLLIEKCRELRKKQFTLGKIVKVVGIPKTTVYSYICDIPLSIKVRNEIKKETIRRLKKFSLKKKGKCIPGRIVPKPVGWTNGLLFLTAHFIFDGEIRGGSCVYQNRNIILIDSVRNFMENIFNIKPYYRFYK